MTLLFEISLPLAMILQLAAVDPRELVERESLSHRIDASAYALTDARKLDLLKRHGADAGEGHLSGRIFTTRSGLVYVPVARDRAAIDVRLRDSRLVERLVRHAAIANAQWLAAELKRPATIRELFLAQVAPRAEALALIKAHERDAGRPARALAPAAALDYPELFFARTGARSVADVSRLIEIELARAETTPALGRMPACGPAGWCTVVTEARRHTHASVGH